MKTYPIQDKEVIADIADYLAKRSKRDEMLVWVLVYTGYRIGDALKLRVRDVVGSDGKIKEHINIMEAKTASKREVVVIPELEKRLKEYVVGKSRYEFLFPSNKVSKRFQVDNDYNGPTPITPQRAWKILNDAGKLFGIKLSPHALRKTFARMLYDDSKDIHQVKDALGHKSSVQTETYIGLGRSSLYKSMMKLKI